MICLVKREDEGRLFDGELEPISYVALLADYASSKNSMMSGLISGIKVVADRNTDSTRGQTAGRFLDGPGVCEMTVLRTKGLKTILYV